MVFYVSFVSVNCLLSNASSPAQLVRYMYVIVAQHRPLAAIHMDQEQQIKCVRTPQKGGLIP